MTAPIALGPFRLDAPIGRGGMGVVWRGEHDRVGVPVAIKAITGAKAASPRYHAAFRREVQAVAALDHPGIVLVYDYGRIDAAAATGSAARAGHALVAGSPFLAMEYAERGSLQERWPHAWTWPELRDVLEQILGALAHAHARDVIHRDLKPGNVLVFADPEGRRRCKLADFGIARALTDDDGADRAHAAGTPFYMAPEQHRGDARELGPWTDLYMLGCVAWELATGLPPFLPELDGSGAVAAREAWRQLAEAHLRWAPPRLRPTNPVPADFEAWLLRLLAKEPADRFELAADALAGLASLGEATPADAAPPGLAPLRGFDTLDAATQIPLDEQAWPGLSTLDPARSAADGEALGAGGVPGGAPPPLPRPTPHTPDTWRGDGVRSGAHLLGAGLGLYGLRSVPLVGRIEERDALWQALHDVSAGGRARAVVLRGGVGSGKSRLASWVQQRAHELGAAGSLRALHSELDSPLEGTVRLLEGHLRAAGLDRGQVLARASRVLDAHARRVGAPTPLDQLAQILTELLRPSLPGSRPTEPRPVRAEAPFERHEAVRELLDRAAATRPLVVWLDDVQWGANSVRLAEHVLNAQRRSPAPLLLVLTVRDEALAPGSPAEAALEDLEARPDVRALTIAALDGEARQGLVRELLGLDGELASRVAERTAGNPLFAVQLVGDWVARGVLEPGQGGFALRPGEQAEIPDDIHEVWRARFDTLLTEQPPFATPALELAACLGQQVHQGEWELACQQGGGQAPGELVDALLARSLASPAPEGFVWAHPMVRESLERAAREAGRLPGHHERCASMLQARFPSDTPPRGVWERQARHLVAAGASERALAPLARAAQELFSSSDYGASRALLDLRDRQLALLQLDPDDERRGPGLVLGLRLSLAGGSKLPEVEQLAERAVEEARARGWVLAELGALRVQAQAAMKLRKLGQARTALDRAVAIAEVHAPERTAACLRGLGTVLKLSGQLAAAEETLRRVIALAQGDETAERAHGLLALAQVLGAQGRGGEAEAFLRESIADFESRGSRFGASVGQLELAELIRAAGHLEEAQSLYESAADALRAIGSGSEVFARFNQGLTLRARGLDDEALAVLRLSLDLARESGSPILEAIAHALLLPAWAADPDAWDRGLAAVAPLLDGEGALDPDVLRSLELACGRAAAAGEADRAAALRSRLAR